jgi:hypothetical protein
MLNTQSGAVTGLFTGHGLIFDETSLAMDVKKLLNFLAISVGLSIRVLLTISLEIFCLLLERLSASLRICQVF